MKAIRHALELALAALLAPLVRFAALLGWRARAVTVVGWWGSETVGDVAILGQLLAECRQVAPGRPVRIVSFRPAVTRASLVELERRDVRVIPVGTGSAVSILTAHAVVVGGGPLMESPSMRVLAWRLRLARVAGARVVLYAVGIGPIRTQAVAASVRSIVNAATHIAVRDRPSLEWDGGRAAARQALVCVDPAWHYVRGIYATPARRATDVLALALRTPPSAYLDSADTEAAAESFVDTVAAALNTLCGERALRLEGCVMHEGLPDSDDRALYERLRERLDQPARLHVRAGSHSIRQVAEVLGTATAALTVRFHGFIVAAALDTPTVAVDYARPEGKVSAAAELLDRGEAVLRWDELNVERLLTALRRALEADTVPVAPISEGTEARVTMLRRALA